MSLSFGLSGNCICHSRIWPNIRESVFHAQVMMLRGDRAIENTWLRVGENLRRFCFERGIWWEADTNPDLTRTHHPSPRWSKHPFRGAILTFNGQTISRRLWILKQGKCSRLVSRDYKLIRHEDAVLRVNNVIDENSDLGKYKVSTEFYNDAITLR